MPQVLNSRLVHARWPTWTLGLGIATLGVWLIFTPWGLHWDFAQVYDTGHRTLAGESRNFYSSTSAIEGRAPVGVMRFWGAPLAGILYAPLAMLEPQHALRVFKLQNLIAYALALWIFVGSYLAPLGTGRTDERPLEILAFLVLIVLFQPFWTVFLVGGQTTPTVFLLLVVFLVTFVRGRVLAPALALTIVLLIKPGFVLMVPIFALGRQWKLLVALAAMMAAAAAMSVAAFGWALNVVFVTQAAGGLDDPRFWTYNSSVAAFVQNFQLVGSGDPSTASGHGVVAATATLTRFVLALILVGLCVRARRARLTRVGERNYLTLMALLFFLFVSEIIWEHYLMVLFIPAVYVLARRAYFSKEALGLVTAALLLSAAQNLYIALTLNRLVVFDTVLEVLAVGLYKSGPLLLTLAFLLRHHESFVASQPSTLR